MFKIEDGRTSFWQWDLNQRIIVEDDICGEIHFCNGTDDCALVCRVYEDGGKKVADVPNILLQTPAMIRVYAYVADGDEKYTRHEAWFTVIARTKPADYIYTETELYTVEEMLEEALQAAKDSGDFKGDKGDKGDAGTTDHALLTNRDKPDQHPISAITGLEEALANAGGGGGSYKLPIATPDTLGGVTVATWTEGMTQPVGADKNGKLWIEPSKVDPMPKTEDMTQPVGVDESGGLWTLPSGGGSGGGDNAWKLIGKTTTETEVSTIKITSDEIMSEFLVYYSVPPIAEDTGGTAYAKPVYMNEKGETNDINCNVNVQKPNTKEHRQIWHITPLGAIRQIWEGSSASHPTLGGISENASKEIRNYYENGGGLVGFQLYWNLGNVFPINTYLEVWGR